MHWKLFLTVLATVFVAEIGDKTQLATVLYAADPRNPKLPVFFGAATGLMLAVVVGVLAGSFLSQRLNPKVLSWAAGGGFILIGVWTILRAR